MSESSEQVPTGTKTDFKNAVSEYVKIYDHLADIRKQTSELNKRKKKLSEIIINFMTNNSAEFCDLGGDGSIQLKQQKTSAPLKQETIQNLLTQLGKSEQEASSTAEFLITHKVVNVKPVIKRSLNND